MPRITRAIIAMFILISVCLAGTVITSPARAAETGENGSSAQPPTKDGSDPVGKDGPASATTDGSDPASKATQQPKLAPRGAGIDSWMPNKTLQAVILADMQSEGILGLSATVDDITRTDMARLTTISNHPSVPQPDGSKKTEYWELRSGRPGTDPFSLEGLQYASNAVNVLLEVPPAYADSSNCMNQCQDRTYGDITDLTPLKDLSKLRTFHFFGNRISDISPLLPAINDPGTSYVDFQYNQIADFSGIRNSNLSEDRNNLHYFYNWPVTRTVYVRPSNPTVTVDYADLIKAPNGKTFEQAFVKPFDSAPGKAVARIMSRSNGLINVFYNGALDGSRPNVVDGSKITFSVSGIPQEPAPTQSPFGGYTVEPAAGMDNKFYLISFVNPGGVNSTNHWFTVLTPYVTSPPTSAPVTVHYKDAETGVAIAPDEQVSAKVDDDIKVDRKIIDGYTYKETRLPGNGKFTEDAQEATVYYTRNFPLPRSGALPVARLTGVALIALSVAAGGTVLLRSCRHRCGRHDRR
ncbi:hypothetical protein CRD59_05685 [Bifidobacterium xylocopae]|uniref:MucBP domain-containing protein n=2 Tax=Bifidobacterium xylocopae TaxID=2493119 RepID=A0A366KBE3_9BIFI|nr:hypothetical protein CRD59_05685 [Bifidobacterium xylocopae]